MSFILRVHNEDGRETNTLLGDTYSVIRKDGCKDEFISHFKAFFEIPFSAQISDEDNVFKKTFAFVVYTNYRGVNTLVPLNTYQYVYIMSENGKTVSNLSQRSK